jgi:hypothetical protein
MQGQKYFLGVLVGNQYPIDTCRALEGGGTIPALGGNCQAG